jgi:hypothetical protein
VIATDAVRLGPPVEAAGRVLTPVLRVRYTVAGADPGGAGGFGAVEPLGVVLEEGGRTFFYAFDLLRGWDWILPRLEEQSIR